METTRHDLSHLCRQIGPEIPEILMPSFLLIDFDPAYHCVRLHSGT